MPPLAAMSPVHTSEIARRQFLDRYGRPDLWRARAPGRVNLIGEHVDYNQGVVLPMAIERGVTLVAAPSDQPHARFWSQALNEELVVPLDRPVQRGTVSWSNYLLGVLAGFQSLGASLRGFDAIVTSDLPLGSGLSSSAALEVAVATLLEAISGKHLDPVQKALLCQQAEHDFAGVPCGIMDQFTSVMSRADHLLLLDCRSHQVELVPMDDASIIVLIINTNVRHALVGGEYAQRRSQCETAARLLGVESLRDLTMSQLEAGRHLLDEVVYRRARHVVGEIQRTLESASAIPERDWSVVGDLLYASHASLRDDFEVSCPELDEVVAIARDIGLDGGMIGCRMTGGGFGGCAVSLVRRQAVESISRTIRERYRSRTGREPALFVTRPAGGAEVLP